MKVWLVVFLVQFPGTGMNLPVYKTVATEVECSQHLIEAAAEAAKDNIPLRGSCTEYDGVDEEGTAMGVTLRMLMEGK